MDRKVYEFISKQSNDPIVERKTCAVSGEPFAIFQSDLNFYDKISPTFNGKKYQIPAPTLCPEERQRRRMTFRNERKLYKRKCAATGDDIISTYAPEKPIKVYNNKYRWSDARDPMTYGIDFDFALSFNDNFQGLMKEFPQLSLMIMDNENCNFTNYTGFAKNIYMCNDVLESENLLYSNTIKKCNDSVDIADCKNCDNCYQTIRGENCHNCFFCQNVINCHNCLYCLDCKNCNNCFFCCDLQNKDGYIYNKKASAQELEQIKQNIKTGAIDQYLASYAEVKNARILSALELIHCENCFGNILSNSKNSILYFDSYNNENCKYGMVGDSNSNCYDVCICNPDCEFSYELISAGEAKECIGNVACGYAHNVCYSYLCMNSSYLFGCAGLRNKQYCIFNKQYTKEEYELLVSKIIEHMQKTGERGEFFSIATSPFGYNETVANEHYPLSRDTAVARGYQRQDNTYDPILPLGTNTITGDQIPNDIDMVNDEILKAIFVCEVTGRPFRIIKQELDFYRKHHLPLPRKHPDQRHAERMAMRPAKELHLRICDKCGSEMLSVYPANYTSKVYCKSCYDKEMYG